TVAPPRCRVRRPARRPARCPYTTLFRSEPVLHRLDVMIRRRLDLLDGLAVFARKRCDHRVELVYRSRRERGNLGKTRFGRQGLRSEEHTSELQSRENLVCRPLLETTTAG